MVVDKSLLGVYALFLCVNAAFLRIYATLLRVNGITGQGAFLLARIVERSRELDTLSGMQLRFTTPSSVCAYCTGEKMIGMEYQLGMTKPMEFI